MSRLPSESKKLQSEAADVLNLTPNATWAIKMAQTYTLNIAATTLRAQIESRRQIVGQGGLTRDELDRVSREIQRRVERVGLIVRELRSRGEPCEWWQE